MMLSSIYSCNMENLFVSGTWNCDLADEVRPQAADIILKVRNSFNAFEGTQLQEIIESKCTTRLFVMGYFRNDCVEDTTKEASNLFPDMNIYVLHDGCAEKKTGTHILNLQFIFLISTSSFNL